MLSHSLAPSRAHSPHLTPPSNTAAHGCSLAPPSPPHPLTPPPCALVPPSFATVARPNSTILRCHMAPHVVLATTRRHPHTCAPTALFCGLSPHAALTRPCVPVTRPRIAIPWPMALRRPCAPSCRRHARVVILSPSALSPRPVRALAAPRAPATTQQAPDEERDRRSCCAAPLTYRCAIRALNALLCAPEVTQKARLGTRQMVPRACAALSRASATAPRCRCTLCALATAQDAHSTPARCRFVSVRRGFVPVPAPPCPAPPPSLRPTCLSDGTGRALCLYAVDLRPCTRANLCRASDTLYPSYTHKCTHKRTLERRKIQQWMGEAERQGKVSFFFLFLLSSLSFSSSLALATITRPRFPSTPRPVFSTVRRALFMPPAAPCAPRRAVSTPPAVVLLPPPPFHAPRCRPAPHRRCFAPQRHRQQRHPAP
ncbi:hypothetical protein DENSPDRAFT_686257 [Dentipellis sp. KUC8613]|nr:hypothetical protein DENSPDRAFT_686257 [Dentipellis sp. KUC8613]